MSDDYFEDDDQQYRSFDWDVSKRFWGYLRPERKKIYGALFASLFSVVSSVVGPPIIGYAVDEGIQNRDLTVVGVGVAAYLLTQLIGAIGFRYQIFWMAEAGQRAILFGLRPPERVDGKQAFHLTGRGFRLDTTAGAVRLPGCC